MITKENYMGYKKIYSYKKDLPSLILLFVLLNVLGIAGFAVVSISLIADGLTIASAIIFGFVSPLLVSFSIGAIVYDYKEKINILKKQYPDIDSKIKTCKLKEMLDDYKYVAKKIKSCEKIKEVLNENSHNYSSLVYRNIPEEELERVKVKVKSLTKNRR